MSDNHRCIHGVYTKEECYQCTPAPTPERPTTEEGEERLAHEYVCTRFPNALEVTHAETYIAGLREGKEQRHLEIDTMGAEIESLEAQLAAAQAEVATATRKGQILCQQNGELIMQIAENRASYDATVSRLRELVRAAEELVEHSVVPADSSDHSRQEAVWVLRLKLVLARLRSGKDGGKKDA